MEFFLKFLPHILLVAAVVGLAAYAVHWHQSKLDESYNLGRTVAFAEIAKQEEAIEAAREIVIESKATELETKKEEVQIKYRTITKEIVKYVESTKNTDSCLNKPLPDDFVGLLNNLSDPSGVSDAKDSGSTKEEVSK